MPSENRVRKKRWQVYSYPYGRDPLFVCSFDLREDAQRLIDRQEDYYAIIANGTLRIPPPRFVLVDGNEQTMETMTQGTTDVQ